MAFLSHSRSRWRPARICLFLALLSLAGCVLVDALKSGEKPFAFSHRVHVDEQGLDCENCHARWQDADDPGMPGPQGCALCHAELDAEKPPERQVAALFEGKTYRTRQALKLPDEVIFSHKAHANRGDECAACHAALAAGDRVGPEHALRMEDCSACHAAKQAPQDCATCHERIRTDAPPPSHVPSWKRAHGAVVRACARERTADRCELCHTESSCNTCHLAEPPENHKGYWHQRGHGLAATMDRQNCAACHEPDSCERCHLESTPRNHVGGWGTPQDNHCLTCHEPLASQGCVVCHQGTPSHDLATPMPGWHIPSMNCRQCHGNGQPLPHVDNGATCTSCHM